MKGFQPICFAINSIVVQSYHSGIFRQNLSFLDMTKLCFSIKSVALATKTLDLTVGFVQAFSHLIGIPPCESRKFDFGFRDNQKLVRQFWDNQKIRTSDSRASCCFPTTSLRCTNCFISSLETGPRNPSKIIIKAHFQSLESLTSSSCTESLPFGEDFASFFSNVSKRLLMQLMNVLFTKSLRQFLRQQNLWDNVTTKL